MTEEKTGCYELYQQVVMTLKSRIQTLPDYPTGLMVLDNYLWGFHPAELVVLGGRTGEGKSSLGLFFASQLATKCPVLFYSLEMSKETLMRRLIAQTVKIDHKLLRRNQCEGKEINKIIAAKHFFESIDLTFTKKGFKWSDVEAEYNKYKPKVIVFDFLQLMFKVGSDKVEALTELVRKFKEFAEQKKLIIILLSQINRAPTDRANKRPTLADMKGSGAIEETADTIIATYWEYLSKIKERKTNTKINKNKMELLILKQREGDTGIENVRFTPEYYSFENYYEG